MRALVLILIFAGWSSTISATPASTPYDRLLEKTGLSKMLEELPTEIRTAATRHAKRCESTPAALVPSSTAMANALTERLKQETGIEEVRQLVNWYISSTGRRIRKLERLEIDEKLLLQHTPDPQRLKQVRQIYHNTDTGRFIANVAVEIEYAGWRLSGCMQHAASAGDLKKLQAESVRAEVIRNEAATLIALFEEDTIRTMEFAFSSLTNQQLTEYLQTTDTHAPLFSALIDSLINTIESEARQIRLTSIRH
jgi:hypothetical protein